MAETDSLEWAASVASGNAQVPEQQSAKRDAREWSADDEEPADLGELDYDYSSISEKISAGLKEKEKGNALFAKGEYEKAWKQYDTCFIHVYTSKEEWIAIGSEGQAAINEYKVPIHLNRGLCRLRKQHLDDALWDFNEALRIDGRNPKALYRKGVVLTKLVERDMSKESTDELWDLDLATGRAKEAREALTQAARLSPNDVNVRNALNELKRVREQLAKHRKKYRADQKELYSTFISNLDKSNRKMSQTEEKAVFEDLPELERVRIDAQ